jgi:hypothetical protein
MSKGTWEIRVVKVIKREKLPIALAMEGNAENTGVENSFEVLHSYRW